MKWAYKPPASKEAWHTWFAWRPVIINDTVHWLERVYRKGKHVFKWGDSRWEWTYAANEFDILKHVEVEPVPPVKPNRPPPPKPPASRIIREGRI